MPHPAKLLASLVPTRHPLCWLWALKVVMQSRVLARGTQFFLLFLQTALAGVELNNHRKCNHR